MDVLDSVAEERQLLVQRSAGLYPHSHCLICMTSTFEATDGHLRSGLHADGAQADPVPQATAVDVHAAALFLVAQLYIRQCQRPEAMDVWPDRAQPGEAASSPGSSRSHTSSAHQGKLRSNAEHLQQSPKHGCEACSLLRMLSSRSCSSSWSHEYCLLCSALSSTEEHKSCEDGAPGAHTAASPHAVRLH